MTTFEQELRKLFDNDTVFSDTRFVGRTCYGKISDSLRVRAEFVTLGHADKYEALKISLINRTEGAIDNTLLRFKEVLGKKQVDNPNFKEGVDPHLWKYQDELEWYVYKPIPADYKKLVNEVDNYLEVFREPIHEMSQGMTPKMG
jgi:hypothetical protein